MKKFVVHVSQQTWVELADFKETFLTPHSEKLKNFFKSFQSFGKNLKTSLTETGYLLKGPWEQEPYPLIVH